MQEKEKDFILSYFIGLKNIFPKLTEEKLIEIYREDIYSGYPKLKGGSVWESEGKFIYCLIRLLKPKKILELGNFIGVSTNHILYAVEKNGFGNVILVDIIEQLEYDNLYNKNFNRIIDDSLSFLSKPIEFDLIIQDDCHEYLHVSKELTLIETNIINRNCIIWGHDYFVNPNNQICGVKKAYDEKRNIFNVFLPMKDSISDCGFILTKLLDNDNV